MRIGDLIRKLTPPKLREVMAYYEFDEYSRKVYSQEGEDLLLSRIFEHSPPGFYVDVGAHHPFRFSNTKLLYDRGWRGINIEPNPDIYDLFKKYRTHDINVNAGIANQSGKMNYYMFQHPALNSFDDRVYSKKKKEYVRTVCLPVQPLREILDSHHGETKKINLLSIDVEGMDLEVLKSNNWSKYVPEYILIEDEAESIDVITEGDISVFLHQQGYKLLSKLWKTCLYQKTKDD